LSTLQARRSGVWIGPAVMASTGARVYAGVVRLCPRWHQGRALVGWCPDKTGKLA